MRGILLKEKMLKGKMTAALTASIVIFAASLAGCGNKRSNTCWQLCPNAPAQPCRQPRIVSDATCHAEVLPVGPCP